MMQAINNTAAKIWGTAKLQALEAKILSALAESLGERHFMRAHASRTHLPTSHNTIMRVCCAEVLAACNEFSGNCVHRADARENMSPGQCVETPTWDIFISINQHS